jgi:hypothetical protein
MGDLAQDLLCATSRCVFAYKVIDSFSSKALRRVFFARDKRDLVAATEMPAGQKICGQMKICGQTGLELCAER